ncbi:MAG: hypothetical protein ABI867_35040 [Kofleriaceae bacterium]
MKVALVALVACGSTPPPPPPPPAPAIACEEVSLRAAAVRAGDPAPVITIASEQRPVGERRERLACLTLADPACLARRSEIVLAPGESVTSAAIDADAFSIKLTYSLDGVVTTELVADNAVGTQHMKELQAQGHVVVPQSGERVPTPGAPHFAVFVIARAATTIQRRHAMLAIPFGDGEPGQVLARAQQALGELEEIEMVRFQLDDQRRAAMVEITCDVSPRI